MALRNLVEPQCGEGNPLVKLSHHVVRDKAHKEDLFTSWHIPSHELQEKYEGPLSPEQLVEDFINETRHAAATAPQAFRMDTLLQEMHEIERAPPTVGPGVADLASEAGVWAREYLESENFVQEVPPVANWTKDFLENQLELQQADAEAIWNEAIESAAKPYSTSTIEDSELLKAANDILGTLDDPKFSNTEFKKYMQKLAQGTKTEDDWSNEFAFRSGTGSMADAWSQEFTNEVPNLNLPEQWEKEFEKEVPKEKFDVSNATEAMTDKEKEEFWHQLQETWEKAAGETKEEDHPWLADFESDMGNPFKEYTFQEDNPLKTHPDPLAEGKKCLEMGDLPSAVLLFEAAVQKDSSNSEAWLLLGTTHAANEQDPAAIPALRRGLDLEPLNLNGWMSLATSYTNESYQNYACEALKEWIRKNEEYKHLIKDDDSQNVQSKLFTPSFAPRELIEDVQNLYLKAANQRPIERFDCDVQCGLGILLNLTGEYEKAIDCFQAAIQARPADAKLWNKLGATLANSSRSAEAIDAYRKALELSPGFIRCRYNLGVACINLGAHREAMGHFLEALNMQERSTGLNNKNSSLAVSDNIWSTLRVCLRSLDAQHLLPYVQNRDLGKLNEEFGGSGPT